MKAYLLRGDSNLIAAVAAHLQCRDNDCSGSLVVFPGKRPAHFLRKEISRSRRQAFLPPRICSMDEFIDLICGNRESMRTRGITGIDAVAILSDLHRTSPQPLGNKGFLSLDSFFPIGLKLYRDLEELLIEGITVEQMKRVDGLVEEGIPRRSLERLQSVSWFYERFYRHLREAGLSTRSMRYCTAADTCDAAVLAGFSEIVLAGFFGLTAAEKRLFRGLGAHSGSAAFFQDGPGMPEVLASLGIEPASIEGNEYAPVISLYQSPDAHGQTFALNRVIKAIEPEGDGLDEKTVIVLPSADTLFPVLHHGIPTLPESGFNISLGYPLSRTPLYGFFNNLAQVMLSLEDERVYLPDYLAFVLHPYVKNILFHERADVTRIIFHTLEDEMTANRTRAFLTLEEIERDARMLAEVAGKVAQVEPGISTVQVREHIRQIHDSLIRRFLLPGSVSDFAQKAAAVVEYIYEKSTARLHPYFHPFAESFLSAMQEISSSLMKDLVFDEPASYFHFFRKYLGTCHVPFPGTPLKGLQVLGFLETRNLPFDRVLILDMNEDVIPATDRNESLLPFKVRAALHLPTYLDRDRIAAYHFATLLRSAKEIHFFYVENSRKEKSRFVEALLWEMQKKDGEIRPDKYVQAVFYDVKLDSPVPAAIPKTPEVVGLLKEFAYSASSLDTYLTCQLQFYYRYLLRISEKEGITGEIERADIGRFVHDLLHDFFADRTGRPLTTEDLGRDRMDAMIEERFRKEYGHGVTGALYLLKNQIRLHLRDFLEGYQAAVIAEEPVAIRELESNIAISWNSFALKGRLDRVEKRGEKTVIIDYKTQANENYLRIRHDRLDPDDRETWEGAISSLQLPFYLLLLSEKQGIPAEQIMPLFLFLGRVRLDRKIESPLFQEGDDRQEQFAALKQVILELLKEITNPALPFGPAHDLKKACPLCDFRYICGTQWIVSRR